jgi:hypothetical protein
MTSRSLPQGKLLAAAINAVVASTACAGPQLHEGPTTLEAKPARALMRVPRRHDDGFEHFWIRDGGAGPFTLSSKSSAVEEAPADLLVRAADEAGALAAPGASADAAELTVTFFSWRPGSFGSATTVGVEVVTRDKSGQVLWMGSDHFQIRRDPNGSEAAAAAHEFVRRLRTELEGRGDGH